MSELTPAQHAQRMERWRHLQDATDLGRRFKRIGATCMGDDLGKQMMDDAIGVATAAGIPRLTFARASFAGVDAVDDPRREEVLV